MTRLCMAGWRCAGKGRDEGKFGKSLTGSVVVRVEWNGTKVFLSFSAIAGSKLRN